MRTFKKVKLQDESHLIVDFVELVEMPDGKQMETDDSKHIKIKLHPDLVARFERLRIHFSILAEFINLDLVSPDLFNDINADEAYQHKDLKTVICNQIIISGYGDEKGVQLAGRKILRENKPLNCITPVCKLHNDQTWYPYKVQLNNDVEMVIEEVEACLNGKVWEDPQIGIEFKNPDDMEPLDYQDGTKALDGAGKISMNDE